MIIVVSIQARNIYRVRIRLAISPQKNTHKTFNVIFLQLLWLESDQGHNKLVWKYKTVEVFITYGFKDITWMVSDILWSKLHILLSLEMR